jgi:hypothetical protein
MLGRIFPRLDLGLGTQTYKAFWTVGFVCRRLVSVIPEQHSSNNPYTIACHTLA